MPQLSHAPHRLRSAATPPPPKVFGRLPAGALVAQLQLGVEDACRGFGQCPVGEDASVVCHGAGRHSETFQSRYVVLDEGASLQHFAGRVIEEDLEADAVEGVAVLEAQHELVSLIKLRCDVGLPAKADPAGHRRGGVDAQASIVDDGRNHVPDLRGAVIQQILAGRHKQCPVMLQADAPAGMIDSGNRQAIDAYPPPEADNRS